MTISGRSFAVFALSLLLLILGAFGWGVFRKIQLDDTSSQFAIDVLQTALETKSAESLISNAHDEWLSYMPAQEIDNYLATNLAGLGSLRAFISITGESSTPMVSMPGSSVDAHYVIELQMEAAEAEAILDLRYGNGGWRITAFDFESEVLMQ